MFFSKSTGLFGMAGRLLDLGGSNGGPPPWDLYGEGLSARLIDVGAPTPLGLGIGVGVGLGLGFAPPPPSAVPARDGQTPNGVQNGATGPGGVQYRPWESKNHPDSNGNPPTLLELGRMMAVTPPPSDTAPNGQVTNGFVTELQLFEPRPATHGSSPKLPSFQSQFQHSYSSPSPGPTASSTTPAGPPPAAQPPPVAPLNDFGHHNNNNSNNNNNNGGVRYPVVPAPVHPAASGHATVVANTHPGAFVHHSFPPSAAVPPPVGNHYPLPGGHPAQHHQNGSSPVGFCCFFAPFFFCTPPSFRSLHFLLPYLTGHQIGDGRLAFSFLIARLPSGSSGRAEEGEAEVPRLFLGKLRQRPGL